MPFTVDAPARLAAPDFLLRPITAQDAAADHEAVMESRDVLRVWEQSSWPADDFTVEANRQDLRALEERHSQGRAFTYTVLDPTGTTCLGCVYLMPPDAQMYDGARIVPLADLGWQEVDAAVYFWVRTSRTGIERALLDAVRSWLARDWDLRRWVVVTHEDLAGQVALLATAGLERTFLVEEAGKPGRYVAYA